MKISFLNKNKSLNENEVFERNLYFLYENTVLE